MSGHPLLADHTKEGIATELSLELLCVETSNNSGMANYVSDNGDVSMF